MDINDLDSSETDGKTYSHLLSRIKASVASVTLRKSQTTDRYEQRRTCLSLPLPSPPRLYPYNAPAALLYTRIDLQEEPERENRLYRRKQQLTENTLTHETG